MRGFPSIIFFATATMLVARVASATPTVTLTPSPTPVVTRVAADGTPYGCPGRNSQTNSCIVDGTAQGIGLHDCLDDTKLSFSLSMTGVPDTNYNLQVWAGTGDCTQAGATNNGSTAICWPVAASPALATVISPFYVRVADIVSNLGNSPPNLPQTYTSSAASTACGAAASTSTTTTTTDDAGVSTSTAGESTVTIFFMVFLNAQTSAAPVASASYSVKVKLVGPNACSNVIAGPGDGLIVLTWSPPAGDTTIQGFNLYAVPSGTVVGDGGTQTVCDGGGTELFDDAGNAVLDDAGNPIFVDDAGVPIAPDAGCVTVPISPTVDSCNGASGTIDVSNISCGGSTDGGAVVTAAGSCSQVNGTTNAKGTITGLSNQTEYVTAVAAFDQFGNAGAVSTASCTTPKPIKDFWATYNEDGGNAFCALSVVGQRGGAVAAALVGLVGIIFVRRRRKR